MATERNILADSVNYIPDLAAFDLMVKKRFSEIDLDKLLIYFIDTVDASALPYLAEQFDVLGYKGFKLANNETDERNIIKKAIELHRYKGTLWAVRQALISIGFGDAVITEHITHWATFRVTLELGDRALGATEIDDIVAMINEYKNVRSWLDSISYTLALTDSITLNDDNLFVGDGNDFIESMQLGKGFYYDGTYNYNGTRAYDAHEDVLELQILPA